METLDSQTAMLGAMFTFWGKVYYLPDGNLFMSNPGVSNIFNIVIKLLSLPLSIVYCITHPSFVSERAQKHQASIVRLRNSFLSGQAASMSSEEIEYLRIPARDKKMYEKFMQEMPDHSSENKFLIMIGMAHLSTELGILSYFKANGYTIEELKDEHLEN